MIRIRTILEVADNTGAKKVSFIGVLGKGNAKVAYVGDIITCNVKEATPD
ncbi:MAG: uL14 family ribosomal protein, partial [Candidatus Omnitrophota bacterium]